MSKIERISQAEADRRSKLPGFDAADYDIDLGPDHKNSEPVGLQAGLVHEEWDFDHPANLDALKQDAD